MYDKMKSIPNVRSALTFYNDKTMVDQSKRYADQIKQQEKKLTEMENKYYKQFSEMESAMSKMQSQGNQLAAMLGQSK
jgi:flagellar hook-associated protein 2